MDAPSTKQTIKPTSKTTPEEQLAPVTAPKSWPTTRVNVPKHFSALPPTAQQRELKRASDTFASTGRNLFVQWTTPILTGRRQRLLASGLTKRKFYKSPAQIFQTLEHGERFWWEEAAKRVRLCMRDGSLSMEKYLEDAGLRDEREAYVWHAEVAVAAYLNLPSTVDPESFIKEPLLKRKIVELKDASADKEASPANLKADLDITVISTLKLDDKSSPQLSSPQTATDRPVFDTLPTPFIYTSHMLYSHFAHYDLNTIVQADGKRQTAMLRQLADLLDHTGKILFYYYTVPRLCKRSYPPTAGETVTGQAAEVWGFLDGREKGKWALEGRRMKKMLGDGDLAGLEELRLESLDPVVLRLHEMAVIALGDEVLEDCQPEQATEDDDSS